MDTTPRSAGWTYGALWVLANTTAWALAMLIARWLDNGSDYLSLIPGGLLIGLAQWGVLSRRISVPRSMAGCKVDCVWLNQMKY